MIKCQRCFLSAWFETVLCPKYFFSIRQYTFHLWYNLWSTPADAVRTMNARQKCISRKKNNSLNRYQRYIYRTTETDCIVCGQAYDCWTEWGNKKIKHRGREQRTYAHNSKVPYYAPVARTPINDRVQNEFRDPRCAIQWCGGGGAIKNNYICAR